MTDTGHTAYCRHCGYETLLFRANGDCYPAPSSGNQDGLVSDHDCPECRSMRLTVGEKPGTRKMAA